MSDGKKPARPVFIGRARMPAPTRFPVINKAVVMITAARDMTIYIIWRRYV